MTIREQWRQAALANQGQINFRPHGPVEYRGRPASTYHCAISLIQNQAQFNGSPLAWVREPCPVDGCDFSSGLASNLAVHLNNVHRWDWLTFATKFPPILPEDQL